MAKEPGGLTDFEPQTQAAWDTLVAGRLARSRSPHLLAVPDERTPQLISVDWGAFPIRVTRCLESQRNALRLLDWHTSQGDVGRALLQEEYCEWRVVRGAGGRITRVEITTELPEYWSALAAYQPAKTLELVKRLSGEAAIQPAAIFGGIDPFAAGVGPDDRRAGFEDAMLPRGGHAPWSPYNNGQRAICFMSQGANTLTALLELVIAASFPFVGDDDGRPLSGSEAIETGRQAAQLCRNSDPTIVGALTGLAVEGRLFALDDPIGVYIGGVQAERLQQPDGSPVPLDWFHFERGLRSGVERCQRLVFAVPPGLGFTISDLVDTTTGQRIEYGGQLVDLVQLVAHVRVGRPRSVDVRPIALRRPVVVPCERNPGARCDEDVRAQFARFEETTRNDLGPTPDAFGSRIGGPSV